ncbi:MAG: InlB B-repeat-containing protein [Methanobrevibacter sp.]|nr:InlB B-repeat-containing protein [Methanobrevibacter sp.]
MKTKKLFSMLIIAIIAILMLTAVLSTVTAVDAASKKVKVTWDANGGKIGTAKVATTTVTKDAKVGKLPKTPKQVSYSFKGWYTKKSGGTKITKATKVKKKVTYYAQWKRVLNAEEKKLAGQWIGAVSQGVIKYYYFKNDGTFKSRVNKPDQYYPVYIKGFSYVWRGKWQISKNTLSLTDVEIATWSGSGLHPKNKPINWKNDKKQTLSMNFVKNYYNVSDGGIKYEYGDGVMIDRVFYAPPGGGLYNGDYVPTWMFEGW